jgi:hypothetical protein
MNFAQLPSNMLTQTAINALKNAYEECSEQEVRQSIITAFKAVVQLNHNLGKLNTGNIMSPDGDGEYDPSELCAAV